MIQKNVLRETEQDLKTTKQLLAEQTTLRKAHQETEQKLNLVCTELKATLESTTSDFVVTKKNLVQLVL